MIVVGAVLVLAIFLLAGWAVSTEMFRHRAWRRRVEAGDVSTVTALIEEAMGSWRRGRPPHGLAAHTWAGIQAAQLTAVTTISATLSTAAEGTFRTEDGQRRPVTTALDEAMVLAARLVDMMLYDVPNLRLDSVRVDVYSTFAGETGQPVQRPVLTTTAGRQAADALPWETLTPEEVLARFETLFRRGTAGQPAPIELPPLVGEPPEVPELEAAGTGAA